MRSKTPIQRIRDVSSEVREYGWAPLQWEFTFERNGTTHTHTAKLDNSPYLGFTLQDIRTWGRSPSTVAEIFEGLLRLRKERAREIALLILGDAVVFELLDSDKHPFALLTERLRNLAQKTYIEGASYTLQGQRVSSGYNPNWLARLGEWTDNLLLSAYMKHAITRTLKEYADGK